MLEEANLISESPYLTIVWSFGFAVSKAAPVIRP